MVLFRRLNVNMSYVANEENLEGIYSACYNYLATQEQLALHFLVICKPKHSKKNPLLKNPVHESILFINASQAILNIVPAFFLNFSVRSRHQSLLYKFLDTST